MNTRLLNRAAPLFAIIATLTLSAGLPLSSFAGSYEEDIIKKVIVKDHKVKVKTIGGKAKIKNKAYGKEKVKVKGWSGDTAIAIATEAAQQRSSQRYASHSPYGK